MPIQKSEWLVWPHPRRLPLGVGWVGHCTAPGFEGHIPTDEELRDACNLGYARKCPRLPADRLADAVRFCIVSDHHDRIRVAYVFEKDYLPVENGTLEYDLAAGCWISSPSDARLYKMAECYLEAYMSRRKDSEQQSAALALPQVPVAYI